MNIEGLTRAEAAFFTQTDPDGAPLAVVPKVLLVPPGLNATASVLMRSAEIRDNTAGTQTGDGESARREVQRRHVGVSRERSDGRRQQRCGVVFARRPE
jgi:phage major head subunit gpT-like protein